MRGLTFACVGFALMVGSVAQVEARCGDLPGDDAAVAAARAEVDAICDCAGVETHGDYVSCAAGIAKARDEADLLPTNCKGRVKRCAAKSTCGKPGFVTCCKTSAKGKTRCSIKSSASKCTPPNGGTACVGSATSCCDACADGCPGSPSSAFVLGLQPASCF